MNQIDKKRKVKKDSQVWTSMRMNQRDVKKNSKLVKMCDAWFLGLFMATTWLERTEMCILGCRSTSAASEPSPFHLRTAQAGMCTTEKCAPV